MSTDRTGPPPPETDPDPDATGTPVGRRLVLGMVGLGAAGLLAAPVLQRGVESALGAAADKDPTGLTGLL
ncbi:molybdopterin-dependent oxidoreductase, partial [Streptomyces sp. NPDC054838]